jgi:ribulose-bisphosphate carboxylase large chain
MAMCQAVDSAFEGVDIEKYAETHHELKLALDRWGTK